jgi:hypothetical protein
MGLELDLFSCPLWLEVGELVILKGVISMFYSIHGI